MADGGDLGGGADLLRGQITVVAGAPGRGPVHDLLGGSHGIEFRNLDAGAAFAGIQQRGANDGATLQEEGTLFDGLRHISAEIIALDDVRQKDTAGIVLERSSHWASERSGGLRPSHRLGWWCLTEA